MSLRYEPGDLGLWTNDEGKYSVGKGLSGHLIIGPTEPHAHNVVLTQAQLTELLPLLQYFCQHGTLPIPPLMVKCRHCGQETPEGECVYRCTHCDGFLVERKDKTPHE